MRPRAIAAGLAVGTIMGVNFDILISLVKFLVTLRGNPMFLPAVVIIAVAGIPLMAVVVAHALTWTVNFIDPSNNIEVTNS